MVKRHRLTKKQIQALQDGCEVEGTDYFFLEYSDFDKLKDPGFHLRLNEWRQARSELLNYLGLEVE